ncbi:hypothetical protein L0337_08930 [candidate division KSB1 bacterium]|nr:hypothetical protein [candidate division KSB1 bacterium]
MLIEALEKEKREIYERAKLEGKIKIQIEIARRMLAKGLDLPLIAELTGLAQDELLKLKRKLSK